MQTEKGNRHPDPGSSKCFSQNKPKQTHTKAQWNLNHKKQRRRENSRKKNQQLTKETPSIRLIYFSKKKNIYMPEGLTYMLK